MKVYTKSGDKGSSSLGSGERVSKSHLRLEGYGILDELTASLGVLSSQILLNAGVSSLVPLLFRTQDWLFALSSEVANPKYNLSKNKEILIESRHVEILEKEIDEWNLSLAPLRNFLVPGNHQLSAQAHMVRTICRKAERALVTLSEKEELREMILIFVNRLSDWFFVLARYLDHCTKTPEKIWVIDNLKG